MTQPTNSYSSYDAVGNREDLANIIYDISPTDTIFMSSIAKVTAKGTYHEGQTDSLAAASATNAVVEGDDAVTDASTATTRVGNYCQISDKVARVTGTQRVVDSAGRGDEYDYQILKRSKELKRDMESSLLANNAQVTGNDTTARELAGVPAWIATNDDFGGSGASPTGDGTDARTDGTQRAFAEANLKTAIAAAWDAGGEPDLVLVGSFNKQAMSGFSGGATRTVEAGEKRLTAAIDVYVSDFGELTVRPSRFMRSRDCLILDTDLWALAVLRDFEQTELAKTGDSDRTQILTEYTLESRNEAGSAGVFDLTTS
jgi:hypothetical protein